MDRTDFARLALEHLRIARPGESYNLDSEAFAISRVTPQGVTVVALSNFHEEHEAADAPQKAAVFERIAIVDAGIDSTRSLEEVRALLRPRIKSRLHFATALGTDAASSTAIVHHTPFAEHLGVAIAIDAPAVVRLMLDPVRHFATSSAELHAIALANLRHATTGGFEEIAPGVFRGSFADAYAPERMLMPELFEGLGLAGDPVVFLPGSEEIWVVGSRDDNGLRMVIARVDIRMKAPRSIVDFGFVRSGGEWRFFEPPGAFGRDLGDRLAIHLAPAYRTQKEALDADRGDDDDGAAAFVPQVSAFVRDGAVLATTTTWERSIIALLPRATTVTVGDVISGEMLTLDWSDVVEVAGAHLAVVPDLYPPRWMTSALDDALLARLRERAIDEAAMLRRLDEQKGGGSTTAPADAPMPARREAEPPTASEIARHRVRPPVHRRAHDPSPPRSMSRRPPLGLLVAIAVAVALVVFAFTR